ncbi:MAG: putative OmpA family er [Proteobacteria bacterium]|nr:putative OmpA family er [Pseudomonadota bacterium]
MNRLRKLLLACAIVPLSQIALQAAARAEEGGFVLAQADPTCQPGDANCVPPEDIAPPPKQPEAQPEPPAPQPEAAPEPPAEPEAQPEPPAPVPEAQPEPPAPQPEAAPEAPAKEPEAQPEPPAPVPEAQPEPPAPKPEAAPEPPAREPEVKPEPKVEPSAPVPEAQPEQPEVKPVVPTPESQPAAPTSEPEVQPQPAPQPEGKPAPAPQPPAGDAVAPTAPPPAQPGDQPLPLPDAKTQAPSSALIEKLGNPGAAAAEAMGESVDQKAGNIRDIQRGRREISNEDGVRITVEPGGRVIVQSGEQAVIRHDDRGRFDRGGRDYRERPMRDGGREVISATRDGGEVRTVYDENGTMIQRERRDRDGGSFVLFDNRGFGPGPVDEPAWQPVVRLPPPPVYDVPRDRYRVEMRSAPPIYVEEALTAPPLVEVQPEYTLDQVIYSPDLRERVRSVDLDSITFPSGAWVVEKNQVADIEAVARGIDAALRKNPNEVFLVEGYTDAVGSVVDNLSLSDRRAEAVANVLSDHYGIPPENLVTQGYGESYLKVQTEASERANRRVTVRRITPLLSTNSKQ